MTLTREQKQQHNRQMKQLREKNASSIASTRRRLKEQKAIRQKICQILRISSKTVPEIAEASEVPAHIVLWHITAMKKYDLVNEVGQCGEYYQYELIEEAKK